MAKSLVNGAAPYKSAGLLDQYAFGWPTGNIWYVDSVNGTDAVAPQGKTPDFAFATLSYAISQAVANNGDWIICRQGHTEDITSAAQINVNKAGLTIIGEGYGRNRPIFNYTTATGASFDINSANVRLANLVIRPVGFDAITAAVNVKAADCLIEDCEFETADVTNQAVQAILTTAAANRMWVRNNHFHGTSAAGSTRAIGIVGGTDIIIENNIFRGAYTVAIGAINIVTTATVNISIRDNIIQNLTAVSEKCIMDTITGSTGQVSGNLMQILSGTAPIGGATLSWVGRNYYANALATAGTLI